MKRKDFRTHEVFQKDLKFTTLLESFFMFMFVEEIEKHYNCKVLELKDNGVDNTGSVKKQATGHADFKIVFQTHGNAEQYELPPVYDYILEVKFAPTKGKMVFKIDNLKSYIKEGARILLFYNNGEISLKKPKDYDLEKHKQFILANKEYLQWTIIECDKLTEMLKLPIETPYYMGNKPCVILKESDFSTYFKLINLKG